LANSQQTCDIGSTQLIYMQLHAEIRGPETPVNFETNARPANYLPVE